MELKSNEINENDISASELYKRIGEWNSDIKIKIDRKEKLKLESGLRYSFKDLLIKLNRMPTPIENIELIDIKLGSIFNEDDVFINEDFISKFLRRGLSLFYNKESGTYDYARFGLPKFFDYKKKYDFSNKDQKLKERVIGKISELKNENYRYFAYLTTKVNGENCQVSYSKKYQCWIIASKNVSLAIKNKNDLEFYKNVENFENYIENIQTSKKEDKKCENKNEKKNKKDKKDKKDKKNKKNKNKDNNSISINEEEEEKKNTIKEDNEITEIKNKQKSAGCLQRFSYAINFAEAWLKLIEDRILNKGGENLLNEFKNELGNHTLVGESVGDKQHEHIKVYNERDIIFYSIVNNSKLTYQVCLSLSNSFDLFKKYNLSYTEIAPSQKYDTLNELLTYLNEQYDIIFDKTIEESGEGNVVYFAVNDIKTNSEIIQSLGKLKTFEYRFLRKIREKCKGIDAPPKKEDIEKQMKIELNKKFKKKKKDKNDNNNEEYNNSLKKMTDDEYKKIMSEREEKINTLIKKLKKESDDLLKEVSKSKFRSDKILLMSMYDFGEYVIKYWALDCSNYFDVFASFINLMKVKFENKVTIDDTLVNEIRGKFGEIINNNKTQVKVEENNNEE